LVAPDHPALGDDVAVAHWVETLGGVQMGPVPARLCLADPARPVPDLLAVEVALADEHGLERGDLRGGDGVLAALGAALLLRHPGAHAFSSAAAAMRLALALSHREASAALCTQVQ